MNPPPPTFIGEPLTPLRGSFDPAGMARGEPGLPQRFTWRRQQHAVTAVLETWTTSGHSPCGETYLRRHWYKLTTDTHLTLTIYCDRQPRSAHRWHVYTLGE